MDRYEIPSHGQLTRFVQLQGGSDDIALSLQPYSQLNLYCVEAEAGQRQVQVDLAEGSRLCLVLLTLHEGRSRLRMHVSLKGCGAEVSLGGAVVGCGEMVAEQELTVEHCAEGCRSEMLFKQVLGDRSRGYLSGRVLVDEGAQQSESEQTFASLLTSGEARAQALPQLEIYADDVKCNHGATVGKLDDDALFYMRQRGIPEPEACLLLQHAFVEDVLLRIQDEGHRAHFAALVEQRFRGQHSRCSVCQHSCKA